MTSVFIASVNSNIENGEPGDPWHVVMSVDLLRYWSVVGFWSCELLRDQGHDFSHPKCSREWWDGELRSEDGRRNDRGGSDENRAWCSPSQVDRVTARQNYTRVGQTKALHHVYATHIP